MTEKTLSILDLRDIVAPAPVGLWPPAPFVWVLLVTAGGGLAFLIWRGVLRWRAEAYRREGLERLTQIEGQLDNRGSELTVLNELSVLLKRVALAAFPRKKVASLYGESWLKFLESTCQGCIFMTGPGHLLADVTVAAPDTIQMNSDDGTQLVNLTRKWIKGHRSPKSENSNAR